MDRLQPRRNPHFNVEVAQNGFIVEFFTPEGKKDLEQTETYVFPNKTELFSEIIHYLALWNEKDEISVDND